MANSRKSGKKPATVSQFPQPQTAAAVEDVPQEFQEPAETPPPQAPAKQSPPKKKTPALPTHGDFFTRVNAVPREDWGTRVYLYLYVLEPLCNLKQSGGKTYLNRYSEPVKDEHQIMMEYGSGRYRLMLSWNRMNSEENSEIAQIEFEIYNPAHPPKVPKAAWINDGRNAKWEALLPKEPAAGNAAGSVVEAMRLVSDMRRDLRDEMEPEAQPPGPTTNEVLETMKAAKELFAQPAATPAAVPAKDPLELAMALFTMMNASKAENPVIDMYRDELKALRDELKEARKEQAPAKGLTDQLLELASMGDKLDPLKKLFGFGNGGGEVAGRVARTTGMDLLRDFITSPVAAPVFQGLGALLSTVGQTPAQPGQVPQQPRPVVINAQQPNGTVPPVEDPEHRIQRIGAQITQPLIKQFMEGAEGTDFAQSMFDLMPEDYAFMRSLGADNIVERYRRFPQAWDVLKFREADFIEFIKDFCTWDPNEDEGPAPGEDDGIVDLTAEAS